MKRMAKLRQTAIVILSMKKNSVRMWWGRKRWKAIIPMMKGGTPRKMKW